MTRRVRVALLLAIIGAFFAGVGVTVSETLDDIGVVLLALLLIVCERIATPRTKPGPEPDPWREAADE